MKIKKNKRGFTLVEVIVAATLLTSVLSLAFSMLLTGIRAQKTGNEEASLQTSARIVSETVNQVVRYSSAVFTIPVSSFREDNLTDNWDYIGLSDDGTEIVRYTYNGTDHVKDTLVSAIDGITYRLQFVKEDKDNGNKLLRFTIETIKDGVSSGRITIDTQLGALNSLQIIDRSTFDDPATAVAYRDDSRPMAMVGAISMVFDTSGSMKEDVYGRDTWNPSLEKINILKDEACALVDGFAREDNVYLSIVPFSTSANGSYSFTSAKIGASSIKNQINDFDAIGGTNTGDGMRRAYYTIKSYNEQPGLAVTPKNYLIILVDGETTYASGRSDWWHGTTYITDDGNISTSNDLLGNGSSTSELVKEYDRRIAQMIASYTSTFGNGIKVYLISFSRETSLYNHVRSIGTYAGADAADVFAYRDDRDLGAIFETIRQDILSDLWVVNGPA
ncbi:MAG: VWA domain-containing protein [Clostridia bacterium]|nr:VWA domain-containing protein [Clostridia bacterium]